MCNYRQRLLDGFTLIEMLIVISLLSVMSVVGLASFNSFNKSRVLQNTVAQVASDITTAKLRSQSQVKPPSCDDMTLLYWYWQTANNKTYQVVVRCSDINNVLHDTVMKQVSLPSGITFTNTEYFLFNLRTGTVGDISGMPSGYGYVTLTDGSTPKNVYVWSDGRIQD